MDFFNCSSACLAFAYTTALKSLFTLKLPYSSFLKRDLGCRCCGNTQIRTSLSRARFYGWVCIYLIRVIKNLYDKATSAVLFNSSIRDRFRTTVGVRQGCLLSPTLLNIFLERIMADALKDHEDTVRIGGRTITNYPLC